MPGRTAITAFSDNILLAAAKAGVLFASAAAGIIGLALGCIYVMRAKSVEARSDGVPLKSAPQDQQH